MIRGFTLLETLVYIGLFGLVMQGMFASLFAISESAERNETHAYLEEEGDFITSKISYEISQASSATVQSLSQLDLATPNGFVEIISVDSSFDISRSGDEPIPFSSTKVQVSNVQFYVINQEVKTMFTLTTLASDGQSASVSFTRLSQLGV